MLNFESWRDGNGPTSIVEKLEAEGIKTTRKTVTCSVARYILC